MGDAASTGGTASTPVPLLPDYDGACLSRVVPALLDVLDAAAGGERGDAAEQGSPPPWLPAPVVGARQVVLLVLDGLGWELLRAFAARAPTLVAGAGGPLTSVAPTTTATALTSLTTGTAPATHGVVGYRVRVDAPPAAGAGVPGEVMNVLRWRTARGDARRTVPPAHFQPVPPFGGRPVTAVTRAEFAATGFTAAHLAGAGLVGWAVPSALVVRVRQCLAAGHRFVYAYYDGLDKVAHEQGLGDFYQAELAAVDRLVGDLLGVLPAGAVLVVTSDHGQVEVGGATRMLDPSLFALTELLSGEGRFRWLHARPGASAELAAAAEAAHGDEAWVRTTEQVEADGWFGGPFSTEVRRRLGDVALVAHAPVAFLDPADTGETRLMGRHGSLTPVEMLVPLLAWAPR